ncbi:MAG TPA: hypothetical protein VHK47_13425 [Polyangia bacterium]|nr:hypothetical protein [Polyangia bacterium]
MSAASDRSNLAKSASSPVQMDRYQGGKSWLTVGGGIGAVLTLISIALLFVGDADERKVRGASYLVGFTYWCGIAMASVILLQIFHATRAKWMVVLRRPVEVMGATLPIFVVLFIPLVLVLKNVYSWSDPSAWFPAGTPHLEETLKLLEHKRPWLNPGFFIGRGIFYIVFISFVGLRLFGWSKKQDTTGDVQLSQRQRNLGAGSLPFVGLAMTFAALDWLMSLNPLWFSAVFGVYYFAGSIVSALSILALITAHARGKDSLGTLVSVEHTHNIGKLMLAFVCFWTYIAFSQLLLIWIAGLPEETPFYLVRFAPGWRFMGIFMIVGNFFLPFGAMLSRSLKRDPRKLGIVAVWILLVHLVDIYWLVMPTFSPNGVAGLATSVLAFAGIGLITVAFGVTRVRGQFAVPVKDPYLADSLRYRQP